MTMNPREAEMHSTAEAMKALVKRTISGANDADPEQVGRAFNQIILDTVRAGLQEQQAWAEAKSREPEKLATAQDMDVVVRMAATAVHQGRTGEVFRLMGRVFNEIILDTVRVVVQEMGQQWLRATHDRIPPAEEPRLRQHLIAVADAAGAEQYLEAMKHLSAVFQVVPDHTLDNICLTLIGAGLSNAHEKQEARKREHRFKDLTDRAIAAMGEPGGNAEAGACLEEALKLVPDPPMTDRDRARRQRVLNALAIVNAAGAAPAPEADIDWVERGSALLDRDLKEALACFEKACASKPEDGGGWAGLAGVLRSLGRHGEAIRAYDRLVALVPGEADFWFERADCLDNVNRLDEAIASYERALQIEPGKAAAWADRGHVLQRQGRRREALASNVKATQLDPRLFVAWLNRAELELVLEQPAEAAISYQRYLATVPPGQYPQLEQRARTQLSALAASLPKSLRKPE
jgi:tetratricopeptide (TPR) repeat protein